MAKTDTVSTGAVLSVLVSALTTGYTSTLIAFDIDLSVPHRENQPRFYGFVPDDHHKRELCFKLMTLISALNNLSRSIGCALLAVAADQKYLYFFVGGEIILYLMYRLARKDFLYWIRVDGVPGVIISVAAR